MKLLLLNSRDKGFTKADINIIKETWAQIELNIIPIENPHRIGRAEDMVKVVKQSL